MSLPWLNHQPPVPSHRPRRLVWALLTLALSGTFGCAPEGPEQLEPETWMLGTFSADRLGCETAGYTPRYEVLEDGTFYFITHYAGLDPNSGNVVEWPARWEQRSPGRYRIMRDEAYTHLQYYPIEEGTEWEVVRSLECGNEGRIWHRGFVIDLETGERDPVTSMTPGAMCTIISPENGKCYPDFEVVWCEGTEPPPPCEN